MAKRPLIIPRGTMDGNVTNVVLIPQDIDPEQSLIVQSIGGDTTCACKSLNLGSQSPVNISRRAASEGGSPRNIHKRIFAQFEEESDLELTPPPFASTFQSFIDDSYFEAYDDDLDTFMEGSYANQSRSAVPLVGAGEDESCSCRSSDFDASGELTPSVRRNISGSDYNSSYLGSGGEGDDTAPQPSCVPCFPGHQGNPDLCPETCPMKLGIPYGNPTRRPYENVDPVCPTPPRGREQPVLRVPAEFFPLRGVPNMALPPSAASPCSCGNATFDQSPINVTRPVSNNATFSETRLDRTRPGGANATFNRQCPSRGANATFAMSPQRMLDGGNATFNLPELNRTRSGTANATFAAPQPQAALGGGNATFIRPCSAADATFGISGSPALARNATFAVPGPQQGANATFVRPSPTGDATFARPCPAANATFAMPGHPAIAGDATFAVPGPQGGANATFVRPSPTGDATFVRPCPAANATFAMPGHPAIAGDATFAVPGPQGGANATFVRPHPAADGTFVKPCPAANATFAMPGHPAIAGNATFAVPGPQGGANATFVRPHPAAETTFAMPGNATFAMPRPQTSPAVNAGYQSPPHNQLPECFCPSGTSTPHPNRGARFQMSPHNS